MPEPLTYFLILAITCATNSTHVWEFPEHCYSAMALKFTCYIHKSFILGGLMANLLAPMLTWWPCVLYKYKALLKSGRNLANIELITLPLCHPKIQKAITIYCRMCSEMVNLNCYVAYNNWFSFTRSRSISPQNWLIANTHIAAHGLCHQLHSMSTYNHRLMFGLRSWGLFELSYFYRW